MKSDLDSSNATAFQDKLAESQSEFFIIQLEVVKTNKLQCVSILRRLLPLSVLDLDSALDFKYRFKLVVARPFNQSPDAVQMSKWKWKIRSEM